MNLTVVCFIRNILDRGIYRADNFFRSLRYQTINPQIVLVNLSNDQSFDEVDGLCRTHRVLHCYAKYDNPIWSKSLALNIGLKKVDTAYTMFTDIDYIFAANFLSVAKKYARENRFLLCQTHDAPQSIDFSNFDLKNYDSTLKKCKPHPRYGDGGCQLASTRWFKSVGGYDERMRLWGIMDNDMHRRAQRAKKRVIWIDSETSMIHQWHPLFKNNHPHAERYKNSSRKHYASHSIVRNSGNWGRLELLFVGDYR